MEAYIYVGGKLITGYQSPLELDRIPNVGETVKVNRKTCKVASVSTEFSKPKEHTDNHWTITYHVRCHEVRKTAKRK